MRFVVTLAAQRSSKTVLESHDDAGLPGLRVRVRVVAADGYRVVGRDSVEIVEENDIGPVLEVSDGMPLVAQIAEERRLLRPHCEGKTQAVSHRGLVGPRARRHEIGRFLRHTNDAAAARSDALICFILHVPPASLPSHPAGR